MSTPLRSSVLIVALAALGASATAAEAAPITISACYTGDCDSLTGSVVVTVTDDVADENNGTGDIKIIIENLTNGFIDEIGLLYQGGLASNTAIESFTTEHSTGAPALTFTQCQNDNSGQSLNVCFDFQNSSQKRFSAGDTVTFFLDSNSTPLWSTSLVETAAYAHIQGLPEGGSVKITDTPPQSPPEPPINPPTEVVPEPATLALVGSGLAAMAIRERRRRAKNDARSAPDAAPPQERM